MNQDPTDNPSSAAVQRPVIGVMVADVLPPDVEYGVEADLCAPGLLVEVRRIPFGPFAGLELYLPSALMLFIAAGYFNGFLTKLGEDHYEKLKQVACRLFSRSSTLNIGAVGTPGKLSSSGYSLAYSVTGELTPELRFKLVLLNDIGPEDGEHGVRAFLDLVREIHAGAIDKGTLERLLEQRPVGGTLLVTVDVPTGKIVAVPTPTPAVS